MTKIYIFARKLTMTVLFNQILELSINSFMLETIYGRVILSISSSFVFVFLLLKYMRPRIKISPKICYSKDPEDGLYYYVFKIVNRSYFDLYNINFKLDKKIPYLANKGEKINYRIRPIELNTNCKDYFARFKWTKNYGDHALLLRTSENLTELIENNDIKILLNVTARHGFSNLTKIATQDFNKVSQIFKDCEFKYGRHLDVVSK